MLWVKALHVISVIAWMASLLYLPRLLVYHAESTVGSEKSETFKVMEQRLLRGIAMPSMMGAWVFGLWMMWLIRAWEEAACVVALTAYQVLTVRWVRGFAEDRNVRSSKFYRAVNEIPALLMVAIVILVIVKPF